MVEENLKKRREELGQSLEEIVEILKIRYEYLKAIEDGEFEKLPPEVYAKGYIRQYAKLLNVDPEIIIKAYIEKISPPVKEKSPSVSFSDRKKIGIKHLSVLLILLLAIVAYAVFLPTSKNQEIPLLKETPPAIQSFHVLEIFATEPTWLLIHIDNTESKEVLLKPGDSLKLSAKSNFSLKIGNAAGVRLVFDGKDLGTLGKHGQVIEVNLP